MPPPPPGPRPFARWPWLYERFIRCSHDAQFLAAVLIAQGATDKDHPLTDQRLAALAGVPERDVIELVKELRKAGVRIVARVTRPLGRYLLWPGAGAAEYREYLATLRRRSIEGLRGARDGRRAQDLDDQHAQPADSTGQLQLLGPPEAAGMTRAQRMEAFTR